MKDWWLKLKSIINGIVDLFRKRKIFEFAIRSGQDCDGDMIIYKGTKYYHHIMYNFLQRVDG